MENSIHGHEVLHFMLEKGESFTKDSLRDAIDERFGGEARFHTCSASDMNSAQLVDFLASKGKFVEDGRGFNTQPEKICNHEDGHEHDD